MADPPTASSRREVHATHSAVPPPFYQYSSEYSSGGLSQSHLTPLPSLHAGEGYSFPAGASPNDIVNSESQAGMKLGDSCVVIRYQVENLLEPGWQGASLLAHALILVSWVRFSY